jgi:STE24 endopeptidase
MKGNNKDSNQVEKAKSYNRLKRRTAILEFCFSFVFLTALLTFGWTLDIRDLAAEAGGGPAVEVLVYFLLIAVVFELISFPIGFYGGYTVEKRFGLLRQTIGQWFFDLLKSQGLGLFLGALAVETLYLLIRWTGWWWWLPAGAIFALFFVVLAQLMPILILPLFFKFQKMPENDLTHRLIDLCHKAGARIIGVYEWSLSSKTAGPTPPWSVGGPPGGLCCRTACSTISPIRKWKWSWPTNWAIIA